MQSAEPADGDVIKVLLEQHAQVKGLFGRLRATAGEEKRRTFGELRRLLAVHEAAEEMIVRPVTRTAVGGNAIANARNHEEHMAAHLLADLEKLDPESAEFDAALTELETKVIQHAEREEAEEFALLFRTRNEQQRIWLGRALQATEALAPTHPHPVAAGSTTAQYAFGPFASMLDHARDILYQLVPD